jgi:hypothetical protein
MFILLLFHYWLLVSASTGHHQANIYIKLKMLVHTVQNRQIYEITLQPLAVFTNIASL